jgi:hypothetical protein
MPVSSSLQVETVDMVKLIIRHINVQVVCIRILLFQVLYCTTTVACYMELAIRIKLVFSWIVIRNFGNPIIKHYCRRRSIA